MTGGKKPAEDGGTEMRAMSVVVEVLLADRGFIVFVCGDITSHRSGRPLSRCSFGCFG
jgi:hypothetical protein